MRKFSDRMRFGLARAVLGKSAKRFASLFSTTSGRMSNSGEPHSIDYRVATDRYFSWIYAAISFKAEALSTLRLRLYSKDSDMEFSPEGEVDNHTFIDILRKPNPLMTWVDLIQMSAIHQNLTGEWDWAITRDGIGRPVELWPVFPQNLKVLTSETDPDIIRAFVYQRNGESVIFKQDEIIRDLLPSPNSLFYGYSPLEAAAFATDQLTAMNRHRIATFENRAIPAGVLWYKGYATDEELEAAYYQWARFHKSGKGAQEARVAILQKDSYEWQPIELGQREMDYLASNNVTRDEICAIFKVPRSLLGLSEDSNNSSSLSDMRKFQENTLRPMAVRLENVINLKLLPELGFDEVHVKFDDPVQADREEEMRLRESNLRTGVTTINEERKKLGKLPVDWGDRPYLPFNLARLAEDGVLETPRNPNALAQHDQAGDLGSRTQVDPTPRSVEARADHAFDIARRIVGKVLRETGNRIRRSKAKETESIYESTIFSIDDVGSSLVSELLPVVELTISDGAGFEGEGVEGFVEGAADSCFRFLKDTQVRILSIIEEGRALGKSNKRIGLRVKDETGVADSKLLKFCRELVIGAWEVCKK